jgi:protoporphyrinogen oxidase
MATSDSGQVIIVGGGLTGLSTGLHLGSAVPWRLFERDSRPGGHARTESVRGFSFDKTGHWLHLRDPQMKSLVGELFAGSEPTQKLLPVARKARVWSHGALLRYPFQANLHGLPPAVASECLLGFIKAQQGRDGAPPAKDFEEFCNQRFGVGIARHFMIPYNAKLWGVHPREITAAWCSRFVPIPTLEEVVRGAVGDLPPELGYNVNFLYPEAGGIESLVRNLVARLPASQLTTGAALEQLHLGRREVRIGGESYRYSAVVATLPLPELCRRIVDLPAELSDWAAKLRCTPVRYLNVATKVPPRADYHWLYVPEERYPFYRVGIYTNAVPSMAPPGCGSLYVELSDRGPLPSVEKLLPEVAQALCAAGVLARPDDILFADLREIEYAYVVFDHNYYDALAKLIPFLESHAIFPRGRYGSWTYNSMEDCLLLGRQVAQLLLGRPSGPATPSPS